MDNLTSGVGRLRVQEGETTHQQQSLPVDPAPPEQSPYQETQHHQQEPSQQRSIFEPTTHRADPFQAQSFYSDPFRSAPYQPEPQLDFHHPKPHSPVLRQPSEPQQPEIHQSELSQSYTHQPEPQQREIHQPESLFEPSQPAFSEQVTHQPIPHEQVPVEQTPVQRSPIEPEQPPTEDYPKEYSTETTPTFESINQLGQDMQQRSGEALPQSPEQSYEYGNGRSGHHTPHSVEYAQSPTPTTSTQEGEGLSNHASPTMSYQQYQQPSQPASRPGSGLSGGGDRYGYSQSSYPEQNQRQQPQPQPAIPSKNSVVIKVGMVGDAQIGKTSLMVKYVEGSWDEDYIQTLGVNFMEKTISIRNTEITFSIWDLGGQREFVNMLPLVCNDAVAILFMFDLTRKSTLNSIKEWYRQGRGFNKTAIPFLVGTKYDHFVNFPREDQEEISIQAKRFAKAMRASLIFSSTSHSINVQKIFKIVLSKAFDLKCTIPEIENIGEPLLLYQNV